MDDTVTAANQAKSLLALCIDRGLPASFTTTDVDELVQEYQNSSDGIQGSNKARRQILRLHKAVHELLFALPLRG